jgi:hypothetical protein
MQEEAMPDPTLQSAAVTFYTGDTDDKDRDTQVTITVRQQDGVIAARASDNFGLFPNNSNNGPYNLVIENNSPKTVLRSGSVEILINPVGDDRWVCNFDLELGFTDGSKLSADAANVDLDSTRQTSQTFGID